MADFKISFKITMGNEGGYANNTNDYGGETYAGISHKNFPVWQGWAIIDNYKHSPGFPSNLKSDVGLQTMVEIFYKMEFWDRMSLDTVNDQHIATELFDLGVNTGTGIAGQFLQRSLNVLNNNTALWNDLAVDGVIGKRTVSILNAYSNQKAVLKCIIALQGAKYIGICENNHSQEEFMLGWIIRAFEQFTLNTSL
jgi:lysozyme family protein